MDWQVALGRALDMVQIAQGHRTQVVFTHDPFEEGWELEAMKRHAHLYPSVDEPLHVTAEEEQALRDAIESTHADSPVVLHVAPAARTTARTRQATEEARALKAARVRAETRQRGQKVGRNQPCLCGSGIKFKRCCLPRT